MHWDQTAELIGHAFASILQINNLLHEVGSMIICLEGFHLHIGLRERIVSSSHITLSRSCSSQILITVLLCCVLFCCCQPTPNIFYSSAGRFNVENGITYSQLKLFITHWRSGTKIRRTGDCGRNSLRTCWLGWEFSNGDIDRNFRNSKTRLVLFNFWIHLSNFTTYIHLIINHILLIFVV